MIDLGVNEGFAVEGDPDESPFAMVGDWVLLAPISDRAVRVYCLLRAHVNHARGNDEAWPSQEKLAAVLGLSKPDQVGEAIKVLVKLGAVKKKFRTGRKGRYTVYVVRRDAPPGYTGMCSASDDLHREGAVEQLITERVKRLPHRKRSAASTETPSSEEYTPNQGGSSEGVTPDPGATPDPGFEAPPDQGCKPDEGEPDEVTTSSSAPAAPLREERREDVEQLCNRLRDRMIENGFKAPTITKAWRDEARRMLDIDKRELEKALRLIDWATQNSFWKANIRSMPKFREQYDALRVRANEERERRLASVGGSAQRSRSTVAVESTAEAFARFRARRESESRALEARA